MASDSPPDTLRSCEACGGGPLTTECPWCSAGYQNKHQTAQWSEFRNRMRFISGTYGFLQEMVTDLLERLEKVGTPNASILQHEGQELLSAWMCADPLHGGRGIITEKLIAYNKRVLDFLLAKPSWWT